MAASLTALVKGAGPTGLASAVALVHQGFTVTVVEKRQRRAPGSGRQNVVAIRPEALRNLDALGALDYLVTRRALTDMTEGKTVNQWDGSVFDWVPLFQRYPTVRSEDEDKDKDKDKDKDGVRDDAGYVVPGRITDQIPSSFVLLGDLEDALLDVCEKLGVNVLHGTTVQLEPVPSESVPGERGAEAQVTYAARLHVLDRDAVQPTKDDQPTPLLAADLIVCASGKNDTQLYTDLKFHRHIGVRLDEQSLPELDQSRSDAGSTDGSSDASSSPPPHKSSSVDLRTLILGEEGEIESQQYSVFAVRHPQSQSAGEKIKSRPECTNGTITHMIRKDGTGVPPQPLTEITMSHRDVSHFIVHLPRDLDLDLNLDLSSQTGQPSLLESYVTERVNAKLDTAFTGVQDMYDRDAIVVGDPLTPVRVETATAPQFVYGSNVILVGDAAMSCSPASGLGADIGMTNDSRNVGLLARDWKRSAQNQDVEAKSKGRKEALDRFHRRKAESAVLWAQASRMFYVTGKEAEDILAQKRSYKKDMSEI